MKATRLETTSAVCYVVRCGGWCAVNVMRRRQGEVVVMVMDGYGGYLLVLWVRWSEQEWGHNDLDTDTLRDTHSSRGLSHTDTLELDTVWSTAGTLSLVEMVVVVVVVDWWISSGRSGGVQAHFGPTTAINQSLLECYQHLPSMDAYS